MAVTNKQTTGGENQMKKNPLWSDGWMKKQARLKNKIKKRTGCTHQFRQIKNEANIEQ